MALEPGSTAGPYRIIEQIGRGGMASVYKAYEPGLDRYVALKVLPREFLHDPDFAKRFLIEARAIASLEHPNIIPIYGFDIEQGEGIPWMAMRFIASGALSSVLKAQRLTAPRAVQILRGVADALDYAHGKKVVHRDVKPQNILLDEAQRVYLADFGIVKMLESPSGLTATGMITGTPQYMAPEQATAKEVDHRADIYALGIVAYEMFVGRVPFSADTPVAVLMKHMQEPIPLPSPAQVPEPLVRALLKATAKSPGDRWPSAGAFATALEAGLRSAPAADADTAGPPTVELARASFPGVTVVGPTRVCPATAARPPAPPLPRPVAVPAGRGRALVVGIGVGGFLAVAVVVGVMAWRRGGPQAPPSTGAPPEPIATSAGPVAVTGPVEPRPIVTAPPVTALHVIAAPTPATAPPAPLPPATARPAPPSAPPAPARTMPSTTVPEPVRSVAPAVSPVVLGLVQSLGATEGRTRWRAAEALGNLGSEAQPAVPALTSALGDRSADVRWRAAEALGKIGTDAGSAVGSLAALLRDRDVLVRGEAAKALGRLGSTAESAVPALAEGLRSTEVAFRREVAKALARIGSKAGEAVPALSAALGDKDTFVRMESARALGNVGPPARAALSALATAARDPELLVARQAQEALKKLGAE